MVELMITLAVLIILILLAVPPFLEFRERSIARGAAEQLATFWANARFEAIKRDTPIKVTFKRSSDDSMCLGAAVQLDTTNYSACDCFTANACDVGRYPSDQAEWRGAKWVANPAVGNNGVVFIDPKQGLLTQMGDAGSVTLRSPSTTSHQYRLRFVIDLLGRGTLCEPADAPMHLPDFSTRQCG